MRSPAFVLLLLAFAMPARAQLTGLTDERHIESNVLYLGHTDPKSQDGPGSFQPWIGAMVHSFVQVDQSGSSAADAFQNSVFYFSGLNFSGGTSGNWAIKPGTGYNAQSHVRWRFHADRCIEYTAHLEVDPGDLVGTAWVEIRGSGGRVHYLDGGIVDTTGRLASGDYIFEGMSSVNANVENRDGGTYSIIFDCNVCASTPIGDEPRDTTVACNTGATFCVVPAGPIQNFTYQWRRNGILLVNTSHYSGVTSNCLTIAQACFADAGPYDCLVTANGVTTPTRAATLSVTPGPVGVPSTLAGWSLDAPVPNPSFASSVLHYEAPRPFFARVSIHDAAGRAVRRFAPRMLDASGTLTWDGRSDSGTPAVPGIYFVRMEWEDKELVQRLVRVR
jgi:hypothetical protein